MTPSLSSSTAAGYAAVHWSRQSCGLIAVTDSTARSTSSSVAPPVETISGLPNAATWRSSGVFVRSPDAILYAGRSSSSRRSALVSSNAVAKKTSSSSRAQARSSAYASRSSSSASRCSPYVGPKLFSFSYGLS